MENIICDKFASDNAPCSMNELRFAEGVCMKVITSSKDYLDDVPQGNPYTHSFMQCCSSVKTTYSNWFYVIPPCMVERISTWIKELNPQFPTFDMKIFEIKSDITDVKDYSVMKFPPILYQQKNSNGYIYVKLKTTRKPYDSSEYEYIDFAYITFLPLNLIEFCIEKDRIITRDNLEDTIRWFFEQKLSDVITEMKKEGCSFIIYRKVNYFTCNDSISARSIIDFSDFTSDNLTPYLREIMDVNFNLISEYVNDKIKNKVGDTIHVLRVKYSKYTYRVERYLAHILVRAAFSDEMYPFIEQYYLVKKKLKKLYFWNLIFITQFGFRMYYYYWLTHQRLFRFTTPEEFHNYANSYSGISAQDFFGNYFFMPQKPCTVMAHLIYLYKKGDFKGFYENINCNIRVRPIEKFKDKSVVFRIKDSYQVTCYDKSHYWIMNDAYDIRRYNKSNFEVV